MTSRRRFLGLIGGTALATAGCLDRSPTAPGTDGDPADATPKTVDDGPTTTPGDLPEWTPAWTLPFDDWHVLGLDVGDELLFVRLSRNDGPSAVAAVDPDAESVRWQTDAEGEAVGRGYAGSHARGNWGVTLGDGAVYTVAGPADEREWSAVHALDRANGESLWTLERERKLTVAGVVGDLVVVTGLEFFPEPGETPVSHQTPEEPLSMVVYGLQAGDGSVRWTREFTGVDDVAVGPRTVYLAAGDRLVGLDKQGETQFTYDAGPSTQVEVTGDRAFYLTGEDEGATLHGVAPNGDADWQRDLPVDELLLAGDRCYAGGDAVVAVEADGTVAWRDDDHGGWLLTSPDGETLYARSGRRADAATAYDTDGTERWTFSPPSDNAWAEAATNDALVATAITGESADEPFYTVYAVDADGQATAARSADSVSEAVGFDGTVYLADGDSGLLALEP